MPIEKPEKEDPTEKEPDGELDFDLNAPNNLSYYCFGCFFLKKDGTIDYSKLGRDITCFDEWIARMQFDAGDISDCAVYIPRNSTNGKWILECRDYDFTEEDIEHLKQTTFFGDFVSVLVKKVQTAFAALSLADEKELDAAGVKKEEIEKISALSIKIMTILKSAVRSQQFEKPKKLTY